MSAPPGGVPKCPRHEAGVALIEFALAAPLLLLLLLAALEIGALSWAWLSMQHAVGVVGRIALTMRDGPYGQTRQQYLIERLRQDSFGTYARLRSPCVSSTLNGIGSSSCHDARSGDLFGRRGDRVRLSVRGCWPVATPLLAPLLPAGAFCFQVTTLYRNEP